MKLSVVIAFVLALLVFTEDVAFRAIAAVFLVFFGSALHRELGLRNRGGESREY
ncbi:MAG: hypothetical protein ABR498_04030 [Candidatus Dormibacteria bacterium]|nr:hypothetical protein [Frankia sp.]